MPSETNFVYFMTDRPVEVFEALLMQGVIVRDFGTAPALRVGVGTPEDTEITIAAFERVAARARLDLERFARLSDRRIVRG